MTGHHVDPRIRTRRTVPGRRDTYGGALERLSRAYEADPDKRRDLIQEIHLALWRSFAHYEGRCSIRTWVYRVAHNIAASYVLRQRRGHAQGLLSLEQLDTAPDHRDLERDSGQRMALERLLALIHRLKPLDRLRSRAKRLEVKMRRSNR
jgi:RNA polymerase sigma-70 factor (ECF subfamily)